MWSLLGALLVIAPPLAHGADVFSLPATIRTFIPASCAVQTSIYCTSTMYTDVLSGDVSVNTAMDNSAATSILPIPPSSLSRAASGLVSAPLFGTPPPTIFPVTSATGVQNWFEDVAVGANLRTGFLQPLYPIATLTSSVAETCTPFGVLPSAQGGAGGMYDNLDWENIVPLFFDSGFATQNPLATHYDPFSAHFAEELVGQTVWTAPPSGIFFFSVEIHSFIRIRDPALDWMLVYTNDEVIVYLNGTLWIDATTQDTTQTFQFAQVAIPSTLVPGDIVSLDIFYANRDVTRGHLSLALSFDWMCSFETQAPLSTYTLWEATGQAPAINPITVAWPSSSSTSVDVFCAGFAWSGTVLWTSNGGALQWQLTHLGRFVSVTLSGNTVAVSGSSFSTTSVGLPTLLQGGATSGLVPIDLSVRLLSFGTFQVFINSSLVYTESQIAWPWTSGQDCLCSNTSAPEISVTATGGSTWTATAPATLVSNHIPFSNIVFSQSGSSVVEAGTDIVFIVSLHDTCNDSTLPVFQNLGEILYLSITPIPSPGTRRRLQQQAALQDPIVLVNRTQQTITSLGTDGRYQIVYHTTTDLNTTFAYSFGLVMGQNCEQETCATVASNTGSVSILPVPVGATAPPNTNGGPQQPQDQYGFLSYVPLSIAYVGLVGCAILSVMAVCLRQSSSSVERENTHTEKILLYEDDQLRADLEESKRKELSLWEELRRYKGLLFTHDTHTKMNAESKWTNPGFSKTRKDFASTRPGDE